MSATTVQQSNVIADLPTEMGDEAAKPERYHLGIYEQEPCAWFTSIAGVTFPVTSSTFDDKDNETKRSGTIQSLTKEQVRAVRDRLRKLVVRWRTQPKTGKKMAADIVDTTGTGFRPEVGDEPLAKHVYFRVAPPEYVAQRLSDDTLSVMERVLVDAEESETKKLGDPADAKTREAHGQARAAGVKLKNDKG
jgi:hypothetical protein